MECVYGAVAPTTSQTLLPGSDGFFVPGSGQIIDYVQERRRNNGRMEKKGVVKYDYKRDMNVTNYVRQVNQDDKNTYFYKLVNILPGMHDTRGGQPTGKILPQRMFDSVVKAKKMPVNGNYLRRVGKGTSENNDLYRRPYEPTSTEGLGELQKPSGTSYEYPYPMDVDPTPQRPLPMEGLERTFNVNQYRVPPPPYPPSEAGSAAQSADQVIVPGLESEQASQTSRTIMGAPITDPYRGYVPDEQEMEFNPQEVDLLEGIDITRDDMSISGQSAPGYSEVPTDVYSQVPTIGPPPSYTTLPPARENPRSPSIRDDMSVDTVMGNARASNSKTKGKSKSKSTVSRAGPSSSAMSVDEEYTQPAQGPSRGRRKK